MTKQWMDAPELRFQAVSPVYEKRLVKDDEGPSYPTEAVCLDKYTAFTKHVIPTPEKIGGLLREKKVVKKANPQEFVHLTPDDSKSMIPHTFANYLFAARVGFAYGVGGEDGTKKMYNRFKPFGEKFYTQGSGPYTYSLRLKAEQYGLNELKGPYIDLPGLPDSSILGFPINENFVTSSRLKNQLDIQRSDYI
jgi:hypothetical protein